MKERMRKVLELFINTGQEVISVSNTNVMSMLSDTTNSPLTKYVRDIATSTDRSVSS